MRSLRWAHTYPTFAPPLRVTRDLTRGLARAEAQKVHAERLMELGSRPRSWNCRLQSASGSRNRSILIPRGSRPSTAALTSWGARKASESVMFLTNCASFAPRQLLGISDG